MASLDQDLHPNRTRVRAPPENLTQIRRVSSIFVGSDDAASRRPVAELIEAAALYAETCPCLQVFLAAVPPGCRRCPVFNALIGDVSDPDRHARLAAARARIPVVLIADWGDVPTAVGAL